MHISEHCGCDTALMEVRYSTKHETKTIDTKCDHRRVVEIYVNAIEGGWQIDTITIADTDKDLS